jgi:putative MATE family efflux protein
MNRLFCVTITPYVYFDRERKVMTEEKKENEESYARVNKIGTAKIFKLLLEFAIPAIISMVFNSLYNVIDGIFLGQAVGSAGIAVTTLALPVMIILMGFSMLAGQGGNALAAIQLGEGKKDRVEKTLGNTAFLLIALSFIVAITAGGFFINPTLSLIGTTPELWEDTRIFVQIISWGFVFQSLGAGLNHFLRTAGRPNLALITMVFGTLVCVALNFLFVMVLDYGVAGSAVATIIGQACGMVPVLWFLLKSKKAPFHLKFRFMKPALRLCGQIMILGIASFLMQVAGTVVNIIGNQLLVKYGAQHVIGSEGALSAIGVVMRVAMFSIMPIVGIIIGAQPIIGYNYGARNWRRVIDVVKWAAIFATVIAVFFFAVIHIWPDQIVRLFGVEAELETFTAHALKVCMMLMPVVGIQIVGSSYFQSSGQPIKSAILELTRQVIFLIPLYLIFPLILPGAFNITGIDSLVIAIPCSDALSVLVTGVFILKELVKLRRWEKNPETATFKEL